MLTLSQAAIQLGRRWVSTTTPVFFQRRIRTKRIWRFYNLIVAEHVCDILKVKNLFYPNLMLKIKIAVQKKKKNVNCTVHIHRKMFQICKNIRLGSGKKENRPKEKKPVFIGWDVKRYLHRRTPCIYVGIDWCRRTLDTRPKGIQLSLYLFPLPFRVPLSLREISPTVSTITYVHHTRHILLYTHLQFVTVDRRTVCTRW